jgi:NAD(P)-dependent dehydrogenase (short-subunit alcohol dehydrogenase family)
MIMKKVWFITGASRGIGLEFCRQLLSKGQHVIAACRNPDGARELWELKSDYKSRFQYLALDVTDEKSVTEMARHLDGAAIDVLINNAGVLRGAEENFANVSFSDVARSFDVNTLGPMRVTRALLPMLKLSKTPTVIHITSKMGSIAGNTSGGYYGYRMSKTALNMFNKSFALEFPEITSVVMHPGWVKTEMGGAAAPLEADGSVAGMIQVIESLKLKDSGTFREYSGGEIAW